MLRSLARPSAKRRRAVLLGCAAILTGFLAQSAPVRVEAQNGPMALIRDAEIEGIIREDATPVLVAAGLNPKDVNFYLVNDKELQAFVSGGQNIFIYTGLIVKTQTPDELVGVIAHETGHIAMGHLVRGDEVMKSANAIRFITMGLGILAAIAAPDPRAGASIMSSADYFGVLQIISYTRIQEGAADQAAAKFLETAGISGKGLIDFFQNFRSQEVFSDARRYPYFQNHPLSSARIAALEQRVTAAPHFSAVDSDAQMAKHRIMVAKLKGFMNFPQQTYQDYPETDTSLPARYARAIADYKDLQTDKALKDIDGLIKDYPTDAYLWELKGQVLFEAGRAAEAEAPYRKSVELAPNEALLRVSLGQTLLAAKSENSVRDAITNLQKAVTLENDSAMAWRLLAEAYERQGDAGMARLATAEENYALGQAVSARTFAIRARELLPEGSPQYRRAVDIINTAEANFPRRRNRDN